MADIWADLLAKTNLSANDIATAINQLIANERLMKGGVAATTPSTTIEALALEGRAYSAPSGTVTLTASDKRIQIMNPSSDIAVKLPSNSIVQGDKWEIINISHYVIDVQDSAAHHLRYVHFNGKGEFWPNTNTPDTAAKWNMHTVHEPKQYLLGTAYANGTPALTPSGVTGWALIRGSITLRLTQDETWRAMFDIQGTHDSDTAFTLSLNGATTHASAGNQSLYSLYKNAQCYAPGNGSLIYVEDSDGYTATSFSGELEFAGKPTWAD